MKLTTKQYRHHYIKRHGRRKLSNAAREALEDKRRREVAGTRRCVVVPCTKPEILLTLEYRTYIISLYVNVLALKSHELSCKNSAAEQSRVHKIFEKISSYHSSSPLDCSPSPTILEHLKQAQQINLTRYYALRDERMLEFDFDELVHEPCRRLIAGFHQAYYIYAQGYGAFLAAWEDEALIFQGKRSVLPLCSINHSSQFNFVLVGSMFAPFAKCSGGAKIHYTFQPATLNRASVILPVFLFMFFPCC